MEDQARWICNCLAGNLNDPKSTDDLSYRLFQRSRTEQSAADYECLGWLEAEPDLGLGGVRSCLELTV